MAAGDVNRLRLKFGWRPVENILIHLEPRYYLMAKTQDLALAGLTDLNRISFDRAYAKFYLTEANVTVGKQRIAWGSGYIWNPTDVFNPFVLSFAVKEEEETNVEAVRVEIPLGTAENIDCFALTNADLTTSKKGLKVKGNFGLFDIAMSYVDLGRSATQLGIDMVGEAFGFGLRSELAFKAPMIGNKYIQAVLGADYTLDNGAGINLEYFHNGGGQNNKNNYDWVSLAQGTIAQVGSDYLFFSINKAVDELTEVRLSLITNLNDLSYIIYPVYSMNVAQNIDVSLEAMLIGGQRGSEFAPGAALGGAFSGATVVLTRVVCSF
jgi:hypothetical protein